jgi:hypothetical protein
LDEDFPLETVGLIFAIYVESYAMCGYVWTPPTRYVVMFGRHQHFVQVPLAGAQCLTESDVDAHQLASNGLGQDLDSDITAKLM